jgi:hypothetical protein
MEFDCDRLLKPMKAFDKLDTFDDKKLKLLLFKTPWLLPNIEILDKLVIVAPVYAVALTVPLTSSLNAGLDLPMPTFPSMYVLPFRVSCKNLVVLSR